MKRRLFTSLSALSLLLCLAAALFGVRSFWVADILSHYSSDSRSRVWAMSLRGRVGIVMWHFEFPPKLIPGWYLSSAEAKQAFHTPDMFLGFDVVVESNGSDRQIVLTVPYWFLVPAFAILPVIWVRRWRRLVRASRQGLCPTCGYDLRASKERCPECGTAIAPSAAPQSQ